MQLGRLPSAVAQPAAALLAKPPNHRDSSSKSHPGCDDPDYREADDCDRDERAQLSSQPVAGFVQAPSLHCDFLPDLISSALSHFRATS